MSPRYFFSPLLCRSTSQRVAAGGLFVFGSVFGGFWSARPSLVAALAGWSSSSDSGRARGRRFAKADRRGTYEWVRLCFVEDPGRPRKTPEDPGRPWNTRKTPQLGRPRNTVEDRGRPRKTPEDHGRLGIPEYLVGRPSGPAEDRSCFPLG